MTDTFTDGQTSNTVAGVTTTTYTRTYLRTGNETVVYGDLIVPVCPSPMGYVPDRPALSARLKSTDIILCRSTTASYFSDFSQSNKSMMFTVSEDGYVEGDLSGVPAAISALLTLASTYSVTTLAYNLEWPAHSIAQKVTRLAAIRAELDLQGNSRPIIFGPIFGDFYSHYDDFAPYCEGYAVQLQNVEAGTEGTWAADCIAKAHSVITGCPMHFQLACSSDRRTLEQVAESAMNVSVISGVTAANLYFGGAEEWGLCDDVLELIRP